MSEARVLLYTISRASSEQRLATAIESLERGHKMAATDHDWLIWANAPEIQTWAKAEWKHGPVLGSGENVGQHIPLREVLAYAHREGYDMLCRVDDDVEWISAKWLRKMTFALEAIHKYSQRWCVVGPRVRGLEYPIAPAGRVKVPPDVLLYIMPILGGLVRLHHISFFDEYTPDCRLAMGAGDATTVMQHAAKIGVGMFALHNVRVRHLTSEQRSDEAHFAPHQLYQYLPYIPPWKEVVSEEQSNNLG